MAYKNKGPNAGERLTEFLERAAREERKELDLSGQGICELPYEIGQLSNLEELFLQDNSLTSIPPEIGGLTKLRRLDLRTNYVDSLPAELGQLVNLETLVLRDNHLTVMPSSLARLKKLHTLDLHGNPLNPALKSAYQSGLDEWRAYLSSLAVQEGQAGRIDEGGRGQSAARRSRSVSSRNGW